MNSNKALFRFREGSLLLGSRTYIMGIINVTPDSFSDGGDNLDPQKALATAKEMWRDGAHILDIGGQSTRPGHTPVSPDEEWARLKEPLTLILKSLPLPISVDTFYPEVAQKALSLGCHIINDVSGKVSPQMAEVVKKYGAGWVLMHSCEEKCDDICATVGSKLKKMLDTAIGFGVDKEFICLDPGIGFGKTNEQNLALIKGTNRVKIKNNAYLLGASRKRVVGYAAQNDDLPFKDRDNGTVALHTVGQLGGADILRVHNVPAAVQAATVTDTLLGRKED